MLKLAPPLSSRQVLKKAKHKVSNRLELIKENYLESETLEEVQIYRKEGRHFCTTLQVAALLGKKHFHILRDAREILKIRGIRASTQWMHLNYTDTQNKKRDLYLLTMEGFANLVSNYTGDLAAAVRSKFFAAFTETHNRRLAELEKAENKRLLAAAKRKPRVLSASAAGCRTGEEYVEYLKTHYPEEDPKRLVGGKIKYQTTAVVGIEHNNVICQEAWELL